MARILKDPLLHFLLIGACIFALYAWRGQSARDSTREPIVVSAAEVQSLSEAVTILNGGRSPSEDELAALIEPTIREEVLYREALALGLDEHDADVRRRLVEKMTFLTRDLAADVPTPDDATLSAFMAANPEMFATPDQVDFEQLFFSAGLRGEAARGDARAALTLLQGGAEAPRSDPSLLDARYEGASRDEVEDQFGAEIAAELFAVPLNQWQGPFESRYGFHLVRVSDRRAAHVPALDEARDAVIEAYRAQQRREAEAAAYRKLRAKYDIVIEMPEGDGNAR